MSRRQMVIHYYKQFYTGPNAPGTQQPRKLVQALAERGHLVEVIATDFNVYNEQDEPEEQIQVAGGGEVRVHRLPSARGLRSSLRARLRTYLGFTWPAVRAGMRLPRPAVVIGSIQPLFTGWAAQWVARRRRVPFILEVRDLWPDALEVKGAVNGWKARLLHLLANRLYARADRIVSLTPGIKAELLKKGVNPVKIDVFPNGFDPELFNLAPETRDEVRQRNGWDDSFVALYTGTHTEVTAVDVIVRAAAELSHRTNIRFDLFGHGQTKPFAMALATELGLTNVHFHDPVPKSQVPGLIAGADVAVMTLFTSPLIHIYFENKFMDYMGSGKAIVAAMGGHQAEIIQRRGTGAVVPSFDHAGLARLVENAADEPDRFETMGRAGRKLVDASLILSDVLDRYCEVVERVAAGEGDRVAPWEPVL
jgi:glycosyltransferase involved in cell wall biosynthesis